MRRLMVLVALLAASALMVPFPAAGAAPTRSIDPTAAFGAPVRVLGGQFWYGMDMGVDPNGRIHLVASGRHAGKTGLWYATNRTGSWVTKRILAWSTGSVYIRPSLAVDANGRVHIAVERAGCVECTIAPAKGIFYLSDVGRTRGTFPATPMRLTDAGTAQPSLRVASGHLLFLAFAGNPDLALKAVRLRTNASGHWTTTTVAAAGTHPSLRIGMDGKPRIAFEVAGGLRYATASTETGGFTVRSIAGTSATDDRPRLSIDETGGAHVVWLDTAGVTGVRYAQRLSGGWSAAAWVNGARQHALSVDKPSMPWVATGGDSVQAFRPVGGLFTGMSVDPEPSIDVAVKVLDSGAVVVAWVGGDPFGLWVRRT